MSGNLEILHPSTGECRIWDCPCHEFALKRPREASSSKGMAHDSRNVKTPPTHPSASGMVISDFEHDWNHAPSGRRRRVEQEDALFWYTAGARAKEAELLAVFNEDLREVLRVTRERIVN